MILMTDRELLELLLQKMTGMEGELQNLNKRVTNIEENMAAKEDIEEVKKEIAEIKSFVSDIPAIKVSALETAEVVKRLESTQERHERTLDLLSRRSIDQEAELKRIK